MKNFLLTGLLMLSTQAFSQTVKEYDETQEKQCHQELKTLGCVKSNGDQDSTCAESKKAKLSKLCSSMHEEKKS
jgi:hypothetical protein